MGAMAQMDGLAAPSHGVTGWMLQEQECFPAMGLGQELFMSLLLLGQGLG